MIKYLIGCILFLILGAATVDPSTSSASSDKDLFYEGQTLSELLALFGEDIGDKFPHEGSNISVEIGEDIVKYGFSNRDGLKNSRRQSKHFVCTSCHNTERENPDLSINDPQARLEYVSSKQLPFLQATTLYGAVNRDSYYNGDYEKKYGDLVHEARHDIREAIQLCATACAQGRKLKEWELESVLAYLWSIEIKVTDLNLTDLEKTSLSQALEKEVLQKEGIKFIKSKYQHASPATFILPPEDRKVGTGLTGNIDNGKLIYDLSCLHCHYHQKYSYLNLDDQKMSFSFLNNKAPTYNRNSLYQVIRYGTYSKYGKKSYMPNYTAEKLSDQQLADLRAYISHRASL